MIDHFNAASLAKLSKAELHALLASYQAKFIAEKSDGARVKIRSRIAIIETALDMK